MPLQSFSSHISHFTFHSNNSNMVGIAKEKTRPYHVSQAASTEVDRVGGNDASILPSSQLQS